MAFKKKERFVCVATRFWTEDFWFYKYLRHLLYTLSNLLPCSWKLPLINSDYDYALCCIFIHSSFEKCTTHYKPYKCSSHLMLTLSRMIMLYVALAFSHLWILHHSLQNKHMFISSHVDTIPNDNAQCSTCIQSSLNTTPLVTKQTYVHLISCWSHHDFIIQKYSCYSVLTSRGNLSSRREWALGVILSCIIIISK